MVRDFLTEHYIAHKEHAEKVNDYRSQAMTILASGFAPVAGSLIALAATGEFSSATKFALIVSLYIFGLITAAMAVWAARLDRLQQHYRQAMDALVGDTIDEWLAQRKSQQPIEPQSLRIAGNPGLLTRYGLLSPALMILAGSAIALASLLVSGTITFAS
jgi:hypothetical protein